MRDNIIALLACITFSIVFNVPKKYLLLSGLGGAVAWVAHTFSVNFSNSIVFSTLIGAIAVGLWGELLAMKEKAPVPVFIIPGIIMLVPGSGMYYTMLYAIEGEFDKAVSIGSQTFLTAGAIASGLIIVTSVFRVIKKRA